MIVLRTSTSISKNKPLTSISKKETVNTTRANLEKRQLVVITTNKGTINSLQQRNEINRALATVAQNKPVIETVTKSFKGNIILTTTKEFNSEFLLKNESLWKKSIQGDFQTRRKQSWFNLVIHGVPKLPELATSSQLKEEIEIFNKITLAAPPR